MTPNRIIAPDGPSISVVLCTYNRARLLPRAIRSVQAQTLSDWQLVVVDDGSTDATPSVLEAFARRDARIVFVRQRNRGLAMARNVGIKLAEAPFVTFVDSDDAYRPEHLAWRMRYLRRHPDLDMIYGGVEAVGPKERQFVVDLERPGRSIHVSRCYVGGTFVVRRSVLERVGGFRRVPFGEDLDLVKRIERRFSVKRVGKKSYRYYCDTSDRLCDTFTERLLGSKPR
ncbi:MAG: glycosyltransferase family 2 protein [Bacteroidetes bacterium]|jgi:glycosyltransferase involved in cell wall biosynthesis|nr:glycosyltransferase family 2 protein [Bacteroidota bacterium]